MSYSAPFWGNCTTREHKSQVHEVPFQGEEGSWLSLIGESAAVSMPLQQINSDL